MELDFKASSQWSDNLIKSISESDIILAADVIYEDTLTDAFIETIEKILTIPSSKSKTIYIALEKRYVFTVADMDTCAPCYEYFLKGFHKLKSKNFNWNVSSVAIDFPQYFDYERTNALVLWKVCN